MFVVENFVKSTNNFQSGFSEQYRALLVIFVVVSVIIIDRIVDILSVSVFVELASHHAIKDKRESCEDGRKGTEDHFEVRRKVSVRNRMLSTYLQSVEASSSGYWHFEQGYEYPEHFCQSHF